ncbi:MTRF1L release factor glutamine methyltransferase [Scleropages formosus]|uniref:peptide chain release factor N(5)-glutamine methyltransferase n=1 Tax=Scleropages formosus TaxID=113540 RepID=A0A8C9RV67_SCLFO|nr:MTRF1L release factor glutamine methyltransferase [Scleropages formosus]XP_018617793.1 MTRF1L release factor glutamine methyltransferase [Scleropages formosus]
MAASLPRLCGLFKRAITCHVGCAGRPQPFRGLLATAGGKATGGPASTSACRLSVQQAMDLWRQMFERSGVSEPALSSQYIIAHVMGAKTIESLGSRRLSEMLTERQAQCIWELCRKRLSRMPVQYIIEEWDFRDITLKMRPPVFIPRPETEELVGLVLSDLLATQGAGVAALEVGCGSGAISLSLLHALPQLQVIAVDRSRDAVALTRENAHRLRLQDRLEVHQMDMILDAEDLLRDWSPVDLLVSNPPYVFSQDLAALEPEILKFEDSDALDGGADGLRVIQQILTLAPHLLKDGGRAYLETDPRHPPLIRQYVEEHAAAGLRYLRTHRDVTGRPRFSVLKKEGAGH